MKEGRGGGVRSRTVGSAEPAWYVKRRPRALHGAASQQPAYCARLASGETAERDRGRGGTRVSLFALWGPAAAAIAGLGGGV